MKTYNLFYTFIILSTSLLQKMQCSEAQLNFTLNLPIGSAAKPQETHAAAPSAEQELSITLNMEEEEEPFSQITFKQLLQEKIENKERLRLIVCQTTVGNKPHYRIYEAEYFLRAYLHKSGKIASSSDPLNRQTIEKLFTYEIDLITTQATDENAAKQELLIKKGPLAEAPQAETVLPQNFLLFFKDINAFKIQRALNLTYIKHYKEFLALAHDPSLIINPLCATNKHQLIANIVCTAVVNQQSPAALLAQLVPNWKNINSHVAHELEWHDIVNLYNFYATLPHNPADHKESFGSTIAHRLESFIAQNIDEDYKTEAYGLLAKMKFDNNEKSEAATLARKIAYEDTRSMGHTWARWIVGSQLLASPTCSLGNFQEAFTLIEDVIADNSVPELQIQALNILTKELLNKSYPQNFDRNSSCERIQKFCYKICEPGWSQPEVQTTAFECLTQLRKLSAQENLQKLVMSLPTQNISSILPTPTNIDQNILLLSQELSTSLLLDAHHRRFNSLPTPSQLAARSSSTSSSLSSSESSSTSSSTSSSRSSSPSPEDDDTQTILQRVQAFVPTAIPTNSMLGLLDQINRFRRNETAAVTYVQSLMRQARTAISSETTKSSALLRMLALHKTKKLIEANEHPAALGSAGYPTNTLLRHAPMVNFLQYSGIRYNDTPQLPS